MDSAKSGQTESFGLLEVTAWVDENRRGLIIAACVILAGVVGYGVYNWSHETHEASANQALFALPSMFGPASEETKLDPGNYLKVASDFSGTSAAERATLLGGMIQFNEAKYSDAQKTFEIFLTDHPGSPFSLQAKVGVAVSLDAQGKMDDAAGKYQEIIRDNPGQAAVTSVKLNLARIYERQNKAEQALNIYQALGGNQSSAVWATEVDQRKEDLLSQHPELAKKASAAPSVPPASLLPAN